MNAVCFFLPFLVVATRKFKITLWLAFLLGSTALDGL